MSMAFSPKKPGETIVVTFDLVNVLGSGETISSANFTATFESGALDSNPGNIISGNATVSGTKVSQKITGGINGAYYDITATVNTSLGQVLEPSATLSVASSW